MKKLLLPLTLSFLIQSAFASTQAFNTTEALAHQGNVDAQFNLALMYYRGEDVAKSSRKISYTKLKMAI